MSDVIPQSFHIIEPRGHFPAVAGFAYEIHRDPAVPEPFMGVTVVQAFALLVQNQSIDTLGHFSCWYHRNGLQRLHVNSRH